MVSHLFFYQLVLIALVWLCLMLQWTWPSDPATCPPTPEPSPPVPKRQRERTPCAGLTTKPHCDACVYASDLRPEASCPPPPRIVATRGRRRQVDTSTHFCPNPACASRGWVGWGNVRANGHPNSGPWRQLHCTACEGYFPEHHGTIVHGKQAAVERIVHVLACLAEGLGIRATARVFEVDPNTVLQWLVEGAEQLHAFTSYFLCKVHVHQVQLDELYAVLSAVKEEQMSTEEAIQRLSRSPQWVWTAIDPQSKLLLAVAIGSRTQAMAQRIIHQVVQVLAPGCVPLFLTDGLKEYRTALLSHFGTWVQPERRQAKGPVPKPRWRPRPELLSAQVSQATRRQRLVRVSPRVVFGTSEAVQQVLAACGWQSNTACVERLTLTMRQPVTAIGRRVSTLCKGEEGLAQQLALYHGSDNFCLPHGSMRQPLPQPVPTNRKGSARQWRPCTGASAPIQSTGSQ